MNETTDLLKLPDATPAAVIGPKDIPDSNTMCVLLQTLMRGVNHQLFAQLGDRVRAGPFEGMQVPEQAPWADGNAGCKMLGTYEHELHEVIERAIERRPVGVINIGCAEGYYAIGLARRLDVNVYAYDIDEKSLRCAERYAELNNVRDRVLTMHGLKPGDPFPYFSDRSLWIVDCEGDELKLLQPTPELEHADIIVECHDFMLKPESSATITEVLTGRFAGTHSIERIKPSLPPLDCYATFAQSPAIMAVLAVIEKRPMPFTWLAMWANA